MCHFITTQNVSIITRFCFKYFITINVNLLFWHNNVSILYILCIDWAINCIKWHNMRVSHFNTIMCHIEHNMCNFWHIRYDSVQPVFLYKNIYSLLILRTFWEIGLHNLIRLRYVHNVIRLRVKYGESAAYFLVKVSFNKDNFYNGLKPNRFRTKSLVAENKILESLYLYKNYLLISVE